MKKCKIFCAAVIGVALCCTQTVWAKDSGTNRSTLPGEEGWRNHTQVVLMPSISAGLFGLTFLTELAGIDNYWFDVALLASIHVPAYFNNPLHGLCLSLTFGGLFGMVNLLESDEANMMQDFAYTGMMQTGMYSTYVAYRDARVQALPGVYDDSWRCKFEGYYRFFTEALIFGHPDLDKDWKPYNFKDLMLAPLDKDHYSDLIIVLLPIAGFIKPFIVNSDEEAMWRTGESYIGGWKVPGWASIPAMLAFFYAETTVIGIAEESHFRGFIYEDLASRGNLLAAKIVDPIYFSAIHIPQEIEMDYTAGQITLDFVQRAVLTFYLDFLYDRGGLTHSVTAHMLIDFSQLFAGWLLHSGVPQTGVESLLSVIPPAGVTFRFAF